MEEGIEKKESTKNTEEVEVHEFLQEREEIEQEDIPPQKTNEEKKQDTIL